LAWSLLIHFLCGILRLDLFFGGDLLLRIIVCLLFLNLDQLWSLSSSELVLNVLLLKCVQLLLLDEKLIFSHILLQKQLYSVGLDDRIEGHVQALLFNRVLFFKLYFPRLKRKTFKRQLLTTPKRVGFLLFIFQLINQN
jgi:hypothetical protein